MYTAHPCRLALNGEWPELSVDGFREQNLIVLCKIIRIASEETAFESGKILLNREREQEQLCKTRYPLLMVHGVFSGILNTSITGAGCQRSWNAMEP